MYDVYQGDKAFRQGKLQKAINYYQDGLVLYPEHYRAWYNLGNIYVAYEDYYAATDAYEKAIENKNNFTLARMNLGIISAEKLGNFDGAISQYDAIIKSQRFLWMIPFVFNNKYSERTNRGLAYYNMGVAYRAKSIYNNGDTKHNQDYLAKAAEAYQKAIEILKKNYDAQYNLALTYHLMGDYKNAGLNYCKAIELSPMDYEAHYNLAILLRHLRMYKEAYGELEKANVLVTNGGQSGSNAKSYVFDVLNDVSKTLVVNNQYNYLVEKVDDEPSSSDVTYVNGRLVATDALDRAMLKNFQTCETKDFFEEYQ